MSGLFTLRCSTSSHGVLNGTLERRFPPREPTIGRNWADVTGRSTCFVPTRYLFWSAVLRQAGIPVGPKAVLDRPDGDLRAGIEGEFIKDALYVPLGRPLRNYEARGNFPIRQPLRDKRRYFALARGERS